MGFAKEGKLKKKTKIRVILLLTARKKFCFSRTENCVTNKLARFLFFSFFPLICARTQTFEIDEASVFQSYSLFFRTVRSST